MIYSIVSGYLYSSGINYLTQLKSISDSASISSSFCVNKRQAWYLYFCSLVAILVIITFPYDVCKVGAIHYAVTVDANPLHR